ncbi:MAG: hypothetical protein ACOH2F_02315 [Cellulomonas sp.]
MADSETSTELELAHRAHHVAGAIYGTILATSVVAAAAHDPELINHAVFIVVGTSLVFWLAHVYSLGLSARMLLRRPIRRDEVASLARAEWPMLQSCWPIVLALMLGVTGIVDRAVAVNLALATGIGALFTYGLIIGRQENMRWPRALLNAAAAGAFGLAVLALKVVVH